MFHRIVILLLLKIESRLNGKYSAVINTYALFSKQTNCDAFRSYLEKKMSFSKFCSNLIISNFIEYLFSPTFNNFLQKSYWCYFQFFSIQPLLKKLQTFVFLMTSWISSFLLINLIGHMPCF